MTLRHPKAYNHVFGTDGEYFFASLLDLTKVNNGYRKPDLVANGQYPVPFEMEVKTGRSRKAVINDFQLHTAIPHIPEGRTREFPPLIQPIATYVGIIHRTDTLRALDLNDPLNAVRITWGDCFLAPIEYIFYQFAIQSHIRTDRPLKDIVRENVSLAQRDYDLNRHTRKGKTKQSWQNLSCNDITALVNPDMEYRGNTARRLELLKGLYDMEKIQGHVFKLDGDITLTALMRRGDEALFTHIGRRIKKNKEKMASYREQRAEYEQNILAGSTYKDIRCSRKIVAREVPVLRREQLNQEEIPAIEDATRWGYKG